MSCIAHKCQAVATHGFVLDDRWSEQTKPGPNFKPLEIVLGCEEHLWGLIRRCVITMYSARLIEECVLTPEKVGRWVDMVIAGEAVVRGKHKS